MKPKILIVDDHPAIRTTMKDVLENEGFETQVAKSGDDAIDMYQANNFNFVLMDMQMPGLKGLEVFRMLLQIERSHAKFIFITAFSAPELEKQARELGCLEFLQKPIRVEKVVELIRSRMRTSILLFINNKTLQESVCNELNKEGYTIEKSSRFDDTLIMIRQIDFNFVVIDEDSPSIEQHGIRKTIKVINSKSKVVEINEDEDPKLVISRMNSLHEISFSI